MQPICRDDASESFHQSLKLSPTLLIQFVVSHEVDILKFVVTCDLDERSVRFDILCVKSDPCFKNVPRVVTAPKMSSSIVKVRPKSSTFPIKINLRNLVSYHRSF